MIDGTPRQIAYSFVIDLYSRTAWATLGAVRVRVSMRRRNNDARQRHELFDPYPTDDAILRRIVTLPDLYHIMPEEHVSLTRPRIVQKMLDMQ